MEAKELKEKIEKLEKTIASPLVPETMKAGLKSSVEKLQKQLEELEKTAEKKVEVAEKKADAPAEKKAEKEVKEAKAEVKEIKKVVEKVKAVEKKVAVAEKKAEAKVHGGARPNAGRKKDPMRMVKPKGAWGGKRPDAGRRASSKTKIRVPKGKKVTPLVSKHKAKKAIKVVTKIKNPVTAVAKVKTKTVRAFGQTVAYKNDADFCKQLISAFKKRKSSSKKGARKKTKPVFGVITTSVKNAVSKALHNASDKQIQKDPRAFLAKAQRLEKSAIRFLEDFKAILGVDYKKSEINSEFGELEKTIKAYVAKFTKK